MSEQVESAVGDEDQLLALYREAIAVNGAMREEIGKLRGELCSVKHNEKQNQEGLLALERALQVKLHGERGDNGITGRLAHCERRIGLWTRVGAGVLSGLAVLTWWAWRMVVAP